MTQQPPLHALERYECSLPNKCHTIGYPKFISYSDVMNPANSYLHDGHLLVIRCKVTVRYNEVTIPSLSPNALIDSVEENHFKLLLDSGVMSDFTIKIKDNENEFRVHKIILSTRSTFFRNLFNGSSNENRYDADANTFTIDEKPDLVKAVLQFIYAAVKPENYSLELMRLAAEFNVDCLTSLCANHFATNLQLDTVTCHRLPWMEDRYARETALFGGGLEEKAPLLTYRWWPTNNKP
ncbi:hypothetical protein TYRP_023588 [Tyrophagus putrescentiae]|nr:hypothetical protein TYRP_023588 [Tyrophagus putrescentiae]